VAYLYGPEVAEDVDESVELVLKEEALEEE